MEMCEHCWGLHKTRCEACGLTITDWRKIVGDGAIEANAYWLATWFKLRKFSQETSGDLETDWKCRRMFGPWLFETMDRIILYQIIDAFWKGERQIKCGYLKAETLFWVGTQLATYNFAFTFHENMVIFNDHQCTVRPVREEVQLSSEFSGDAEEAVLRRLSSD